MNWFDCCLGQTEWTSYQNNRIWRQITQSVKYRCPRTGSLWAPSCCKRSAEDYKYL